MKNKKIKLTIYSNEIEIIIKSLIEFRKNLKQPQKDANNPFFKSSYTTLDKVIEAIDETAPNHGLSFTQWAVSNEQGNVGVETLLLHSSGQYIHYDAIYMKPEKNTPQAIVSAITYSRRYTISAIFGITSDEDDDGNQATGNKSKPKQDAGKLELVKMNADVLAKVLTSKGNEQTREDIIKAYTQDANINNFTNQQLTQLANRIKSKVEQYKKEDNEQESK